MTPSLALFRIHSRRTPLVSLGTTGFVTCRHESPHVAGSLERAAYCVRSNGLSTPRRFRGLCLNIVIHIKQAAPTIAGELASPVGLHVLLQLVLRDIWHDHVLFTGHSVTGLIDASATR